MQITFLTLWSPWPPENGIQIRNFYLIKALSSVHDVDLITVAQTSVSADEVCDALGLRTTTIVPDLSVKNRTALNLLRPTPRFLVEQHSAEIDTALSTLTTQNCDLLIGSMINVAPWLQNQPIPCLLEDIELRLYQSLSTMGTTIMRARRHMQWLKMRQFTKRQLAHLAGYTVVSREEQQLLQMLAPTARTASIVPNGVDTVKMAVTHASAQPNTVISTGALTYAANYDGLVYFLRDVWRRVQAAVDGVRLSVTGRTSQSLIDALPAHRQVTFTGFLPDIRMAIAASWLTIVPLKFGGGTRLKIVESLALGTPVVTTRTGVEGLALGEADGVLVVDDDDDAGFAAAVIRLLSDSDLRQKLSDAGRRSAEKYDWRHAQQKFLQVVEQSAT